MRMLRLAAGVANLLSHLMFPFLVLLAACNNLLHQMPNGEWEVQSAEAWRGAIGQLLSAPAA